MGCFRAQRPSAPAGRPPSHRGTPGGIAGTGGGGGEGPGGRAGEKAVAFPHPARGRFPKRVAAVIAEAAGGQIGIGRGRPRISANGELVLVQLVGRNLEVQAVTHAMRDEQPAPRFRLTGDDAVIWSRRGWRRSGSASAGCSAGRILSGRALRHAGNRATRSGGLPSGRLRWVRPRGRARAERGRRRDGEKADLHDEMVVCFRWDDLASPNEWRRERSSYELTHTGLGTLWIPLTLRE